MEPQTDPGQRWALNTNLVTRLVGGQAFILMPDSTMHILENDSAVVLFTLLKSASAQGQSADDLCAALHASFDVSADRAAEDSVQFLRDLHALGIVSAVSEE